MIDTSRRCRWSIGASTGAADYLARDGAQNVSAKPWFAAQGGLAFGRTRTRCGSGGGAGWPGPNRAGFFRLAKSRGGVELPEVRWRWNQVVHDLAARLSSGLLEGCSAAEPSRPGRFSAFWPAQFTAVRGSLKGGALGGAWPGSLVAQVAQLGLGRGAVAPIAFAGKS